MFYLDLEFGGAEPKEANDERRGRETITGGRRRASAASLNSK